MIGSNGLIMANGNGIDPLLMELEEAQRKNKRDDEKIGLARIDIIKCVDSLESIINTDYSIGYNTRIELTKVKGSLTKIFNGNK